MKTQIVIEVEGGAVTSVSCDRDAEIVILDHDSLKCERDPSRIREIGCAYPPDEIAKPTRLKEMVDDVVEGFIQGLE